MTILRSEINSNFYTIVAIDENGLPIEVLPEYVANANVAYANNAGNAEVANNALSLDSSVANVHISGGLDGYILQTDGSGTLSWTPQTITPETNPAGSNTQVQFNDDGSFGANSQFTYNKTTGVLSSPFFLGDGSLLTGIVAANANYANTAGVADSVSVANVSGIGNIATINLDGSSSNVLYGNGVFGPQSGGTYSNANVANYLPTYTGNIAASFLTNFNTSITGNAYFTGPYFDVNSTDYVQITTVGGLGLTGNGITLTSNTSDPIALNGNANITGNINMPTSVLADGLLLPIAGNYVGVSDSAGANGFFVSDSNISIVGNIDAVTVTGNVTAGLFNGDGYGISNIAVANINGLGNIATVDLDGNVSNVLAGDGTWIAAGATGTPSEIANGTSNVTIATSDGNIDFNVNGNSAGQINVDSVSFGVSAGAISQGNRSVAIGGGSGSGYQSNNAVALGYNAGVSYQGDGAVAIGQASGGTSQGNGAVAVGYQAGQSQGDYSVAIGQNAGYSGVANNSIILNATGGDVSSATANTFVVKPIRNANTANALFYDATSGEITFDVFPAGDYSNSNVASFLSSGDVTGIAVTGGVSAEYFLGPLANGTSNVELPATDGNINFNVNGNLIANVSSTGITSILFSGDGGGLSNIAVANVNGLGNIATVNLDGNVSNILHGDGSWGPESTSGNANYANFAGTAYSVSAANISGTINLANYATVANSVAGANVSGAVTYATTANSVAGANVSGAVTYATTANSVAVANVSGIGNIATVNLTGSTTNVLYGNGVFAAIATSNTIANGGSNVLIATSGGNVATYIGSNATPKLEIGSTLSTFNTNLTATGNIEAGGVRISATGNVLVGGRISATGNATASQLISSVATGTAPLVVTSTTQVANLRTAFANVANTANSVAGANVSGEVAFAATANSVAGANVSGAVAYATTANSVAGANVSGAVAYATTANSVAVANVSGIGNIATVNLNGSSSDVLYGNGVFAAAGGGGGSSISNGTSNVSIDTTNGNIEFYADSLFVGNVYNNGVTIGLQINGDITSTGGYFIGDGSQLTGIPNPVQTKIEAGTSNVSMPMNDGNIEFNANSALIGNIYNDGINPPGLEIFGNITSTGGYFNGDGGGLSNIAGANVSGNVGNATISYSVPNNDIANLVLVTGSLGQIVAVSDSDGKLAYWDTTNTRWSYVFDNSAV